ncbi:MAG: hypothetical protein HXX08_11500 [Chloroflexi bacterium]|uniref:Uncharacterized protein n=1 Tax=Candidatus Chlorohelix allophototropha TaxID=3003348 RepID=A0A8T7M3N6_9CHLR|nr:hypothetical protein [Chloroflexota bacterium]WJW65863.1 hypothetical protein OZ401_001642 [Chloroflexota bacterium L227-S17]
MKEVIRNLDSEDGRIAILFLWLTAMCIYFFVLSLSIAELQFAPVAIAFIGLTAFMTSLHYYARAINQVEGYTQDTQAIRKPLAPTTTPNTQDPQDIRKPLAPNTQDLPLELLEERKRFYAFIKGVMVEGAIGETTWLGRGYSRTEYRNLVEMLEEVGAITKPEGAGRASRRKLKSFDQTIDAIGELAMRSGVQNYWQAVMQTIPPSPSTVVNPAYSIQSQVQIE